MRRISTTLAALVLCGCGYIGDPHPPLANVPARIQQFSVVQRGALLLVDFKIPDRTTEDRRIPQPVKLDLRIGTSGAPFQAEAWAAGATRVEAAKITEEDAQYEIRVAPWVGKETILAARVIAANGKAGDWSDFTVVPVMAAPERPSGVRAQSTPKGVQLSWSASGSAFRVFRRMGEQTAFAALGDAGKPEWLDANAEAGKPYVYRISTIVRAGANREAESEPSAEAAITPQDDFPPAPPAGLRAVAALQSIELNWDANAEPYLSGYRIYRSASGGAFERIAQTELTPSYSDRKVEPGKPYRYAVAAVSKGGQESPRSEPSEAVLP